MNWLNPINWIKAAAASAVEKKIDEYLTLKQGRELVLELVNKALMDSEDWWSDEQCRRVSRGLSLASKAAKDLSDAVNPDGESGKSITTAEFELVLADTQAAFGNIVSEVWLADARAKLKAFIRSKLDI